MIPGAAPDNSNNPLSLQSAPVEMSPASPHGVEWDCPPRETWADNPNSGVKDLEPLQLVLPRGRRPGACLKVNPRPATRVADSERLSPPEDAEPPRRASIFWAGG